MTEYVTTQLRPGCVPGRMAALLIGLLLLLAHQQPLHAAPAPPDTVRATLRWLKAADSMVLADPARALPWQDSVYRLAVRRRDLALQFRALIASSKIAIRQADYPTASAFANRALQVADRIPFPFGEWLALMAQAEIAYSRERYAEAADALRRALMLANQLDDDRLRVSCSDKLGNCLSELHQYAAAAQWLRRSRAGYARLGDKGGEATALVNLAVNERKQGRLTTARQFADAAVGLARQVDSLSVSNALNTRANVRVAQGQGAAAVAEARYALRLAQRFGTLEDEMVVRGTLGPIYEQAGRLPEALTAERTFAALNDSLNSADIGRQIAELNTRFRVEQQQARIGTLTQQQRIAALNAAKARAQARLWGFTALALALGLAVGGWLLRQVRRSRAALAVSEAGLRAANTTQNQLMRIIGHDLRGPLAAFQQFGPVLTELADAPDPAEQRLLANALTDRARAVGELVDNLLHWSRAQAGQVQAVGQWVAPAVLARSLERLLAPVAAAKGVALTITCAPATPAKLFLDPNLLGAILRNLLGNALKFTPAGGRVTLDIAPGTPPVAAVLTVADTGLGMPADRLVAALGGGLVPSTAGTNGEPGTGLGLAVCRHFAHLLGAEWRGESVLGQGTRFTLVLPA